MRLFFLWFVKNEYNTCSEPTPAKSSCLNSITSRLNGRYSQALLSECGSDILSQSGELRGLKQVDASGRGDIAESSWRCHAGPARGLCNDLSPMVHTGLRMLSEVQLLAVDLDVTTSRDVVSVVKRTDFSLGLFFEIQFHTLNFHSPTTWPVADVLQRAAFGCHVA